MATYYMRADYYKKPISKKIQIIFVDFDGTIKPAGRQVGQSDITAMGKLGKMGIVRVIATGRGLFSFQRDYPEAIDFDYLLFSSGSGLCSWRKGPGPLILAQGFKDEDRDRALKACLEMKRGFFAFETPPNCHRHIFQYPDGYPPTTGFLNRLRSYVSYAQSYRKDRELGPRSEFLISAPSKDMPAVIQEFEERCPGLSLLCSSSPFLDDSKWLEIFPPEVSKGQTAQFLVKRLQLTADNALALGNDFNDLDLLNWASLGLVTYNAPEELKKLFPKVPSVTEKPLNYVTRLLKAGRKL